MFFGQETSDTRVFLDLFSFGNTTTDFLAYILLLDYCTNRIACAKGGLVFKDLQEAVMENFTYYSPTHFEFGKNAEAQTGKCVARFGGTKVLIHYGGGSVIRSGLLDRVKASLEAEGIAYVELGGAKPNPLSGLVYEGIELARKENVDFILGVGGGSAIDSAKAIALGAVYDGDFWDYHSGKMGAVTESLPIGVVLTLAATGTEASTDSVVTHEETQLKRCAWGDALRPKFAIMNPELTMTLPIYQTSSGVADMLSHCMERYFSHTANTELTDRMLEGVMLAIIKEGKRLMEDPNNYEARANIMWAGTVAHSGITSVGRAEDWGVHKLEHELSTKYGCSHGAGLAILTPYWMEYALNHVKIDRLVQFAVRVFGCQMNFEDPAVTAKEGIVEFQNFMKVLGLPAKISEIGGKPEDVPELVDAMFNGYTVHGRFLEQTREVASEIYHMAM